MIVRAKRGKHYGSVKGFDRTARTYWHRPKAKEPPKWYTVSAGTKCEIKKLKQPWTPYVTKKTIRCHGYVWRNKTHIGLMYGDYEIKVLHSQAEISE